ncbi:MAG: hypothetical protein QOI41_446 [Myxococcales bacterium]|jgi:hypothetical protein|nr:hypothetical protein [Myxococcales bacterium]
MMNRFRVSCLSVVGVTAIACAVFACSSSTNNAPSTGDGGGGGGGGGEAGSGTEGGGGGDGSSTAEGGTPAGPRGTILLTQSNIGASFNYSFNASFTNLMGTMAGGTLPTVTTIGSCTATVIATDSDAGLPAPVSGLNAGTISLAGSGTPASASLVYGPVMNQPGLSGYATAKGSTAIYAAGDMLSVTGAGGPDLPGFAAQTLAAPTQVVVTAPACNGTCPDLDRTQDLVVTWTGAGAGKVVVTFETIADTQAVIVQCKFDPAAGTGTVPAALLGKLDKAGDPNISGIEIISDANTVDFNVGAAATTFTIQHTNIQSLLTVSN